MNNSPDQVFKAHSIGDLLAMAPALFGFWPQESLIAISTHGARHQLGFRLRMDLPDERDVVDAALQVASHLRRQEPDGVILLVISEHAEPAGALVSTMRDILHDFPVVEAARGDGRLYWSYLCDDESCCPSSGTPYGDQCSEVVVAAVFNGEEILPDREALVRRFEPIAGAKRRAMVKATSSALKAHESRGRSSEAAEVARAMEIIDPVVDKVMEQRGFASDEDVACFCVLASVTPVRDELWSRLSRSNAEPWLDLFTQMSQRVVPPVEPATLALAAFAAWLSGDGAQALIATERALQADPEYSMSQLMMQTLEAGMSPEFWTGFDAERRNVS